MAPRQPILEKILVDDELVSAKECTKCRLLKPLFEFNKDSKNPTGTKSRCKECLNVQSKKYKQENKEKISEYNREYHRLNHEKELLRSSKWRENNPDKVKENISRWRLDNKQHLKLKEKLRYAKDPETAKARAIKWNRENPEKAKAKDHRRRAMKRNLPDNLSGDALVEILGGLDASYHADHFIPLAIGHGGSYRENMTALPSSWNISKNANHPFVWADWFFNDDENGKLVFYEKASELAMLNGLTFDEYRAFIDWCFANPRSIDEIRNDDRYSIEIWRSEAQMSMPMPAYVYIAAREVNKYG